MKIAVIGAKGFPAFGGAARANEQIFKRLSANHEVVVCSLEGYVGDPNVHGIKQVVFSKLSNKKLSVLFYYLKSALYCLFNQFDVIHVNHLAAGFVVPLLRLRFPVILNVRGFRQPEKFSTNENTLLDFFGTIGMNFATQIVTVEKNSIPEIQRISKKEAIFIPNGVEDLSNYRSLESNVEFTLSFAAGRIIKSKGLHVLLESLMDKQEKISLIIIGDITHNLIYRDEINKQISKLPPNIEIIQTGLIKDSSELFKKIGASKAFIFPTFTEGMSNMLLEVASIGVPIIASDIPQNTDVFDDSEVKYFECGNSESLKIAIDDCLENYNFHEIMAEKAQKKTTTEHQWDKIALDFESLYKSTT